MATVEKELFVFPDPAVPGYNFDIVAGAEYVLDLARPIGQRVTTLVRNGRPIADSVDMVKALFEWEAARGTRLTVHRDGAFLEVGLD